MLVRPGRRPSPSPLSLRRRRWRWAPGAERRISIQSATATGQKRRPLTGGTWTAFGGSPAETARGRCATRRRPLERAGASACSRRQSQVMSSNRQLPQGLRHIDLSPCQTSSSTRPSQSSRVRASIATAHPPMLTPARPPEGWPSKAHSGPAAAGQYPRCLRLPHSFTLSIAPQFYAQYKQGTSAQDVSCTCRSSPSAQPR